MTTRLGGPSKEKLLHRRRVLGARAVSDGSEVLRHGAADLRREAPQPTRKNVRDPCWRRASAAGNVGLSDLRMVLQEPREGVTHA